MAVLAVLSSPEPPPPPVLVSEIVLVGVAPDVNEGHDVDTAAAGVVIDVNEGHDVDADLAAAVNASSRLIVEVAPAPVLVGIASKTISSFTKPRHS